jgi:hypothetical protein
VWGRWRRYGGWARSCRPRAWAVRSKQTYAHPAEAQRWDVRPCDSSSLARQPLLVAWAGDLCALSLIGSVEWFVHGFILGCRVGGVRSSGGLGSFLLHGIFPSLCEAIMSWFGKVGPDPDVRGYNAGGYFWKGQTNFRCKLVLVAQEFLYLVCSAVQVCGACDTVTGMDVAYVTAYVRHSAHVRGYQPTSAHAFLLPSSVWWTLGYI